ncbi:hypothetical protein J3E69DRAFT_351541 [Trichoderma sp. SZMC 28015]
MPAVMANLAHLSRLVLWSSAQRHHSHASPLLYVCVSLPPETLLAVSSRGITMQPDDAPSYRLPISKGHRRLGIGNYDVCCILLRLFLTRVPPFCSGFHLLRIWNPNLDSHCFPLCGKASSVVQFCSSVTWIPRLI